MTAVVGCQGFAGPDVVRTGWKPVSRTCPFDLEATAARPGERTMDLSKLPRLSRTNTPQNDAGAPGGDGGPIGYQPPAAYRSYRDGDEGPLSVLDIFLAVGVGLLFMFLGQSYGKHLLGNKGVYPEITGTGYVWSAPHPKAGQPILPGELSPENKKNFDQQVAGRRLGIVSESSLFLFGTGLAAAGLLGIAGHVRALPLRARQAAATVGLFATAAGVAYALWAVVTMMAGGITPIMTIVAILVGGLSLFMQVGTVRSLVGGTRSGPAPGGAFARERIAARPGGPPPAVVPPERAVHDRFAHQELRRQVFDDPAGVVGTLQGPGGRAYLLALWETTCRAAGVDPSAAPPAGLESETTQVGPYSAAVVTMPAARAGGEAAFVGIVLRSYVRQDGAVVDRSPLVLYYALERAGEAGGTTPSAGTLCEWQGGDRVTYADTVAGDFNGFRDAMRTKVQARQDAEDRPALRSS